MITVLRSSDAPFVLVDLTKSIFFRRYSRGEVLSLTGNPENNYLLQKLRIWDGVSLANYGFGNFVFKKLANHPVLDSRTKTAAGAAAKWANSLCFDAWAASNCFQRVPVHRPVLLHSTRFSPEQTPQGSRLMWVSGKRQPDAVSPFPVSGREKPFFFFFVFFLPP